MRMMLNIDSGKIKLSLNCCLNLSANLLRFIKMQKESKFIGVGLSKMLLGEITCLMNSNDDDNSCKIKLKDLLED